MTAIKRKDSDRVHGAKATAGGHLVPACSTARGSQCETTTRPINCAACIVALTEELF